MKIATATLATIAGGSALAVLVLGIFLGGDPREEELYPGLRLESPNGEYVAEFFGLGGSGAAGWANQNLRIAEAGAEFNTGSQVVFKTRYGYQICVRWLNDGGLLVEYPDEAEIVEQLDRIEIGTRAKPVYIEYEAQPSSYGKLTNPECSGALATIGGVDDQWVFRR